MRNPKKVPILEPWLVRNRWERSGFGLENRRVLGYLMPYQETSPEVVSQSTLFLSMGVVLQLFFYDTCSKGPCGHSLFFDRVFMIHSYLTIRKSSS